MSGMIVIGGALFVMGIACLVGWYDATISALWLKWRGRR